MNSSAIIHEFDGNACKLKIFIPKKVQYFENCDIFVNDYDFIFIADIITRRFKCPRRFDIKDMKNIPIAFNTERREYTCRLPCYPDECNDENIEKGELDKGNQRNSETADDNLRVLSRITDSCVLTVDGEVRDIKADFSYGFSGLFRGTPKCSEFELSRICRITNPSVLSTISRTIQREKDEIKDFCPDQYKLNFVELQIPDGHENPLKYTVSYEDTILTKDEACILHNITTKDFTFKLDADQINIDCGLISILLAICYDIRSTSNDLTCESPWTRTILSSTLSYFECFDNLIAVVDSFLRRCLIYPLYRNYDLGRLCIEDAVEALQKGKPWIVKQLLATYNCFCQNDSDREVLNKFFLKDYIRYVSKILDNDHLHMLSRNLKNVLLDTNKKHLKLGLGEIETELLKELIEDIHLTTSSESDDDQVTDSECGSTTEDATESEGGTDESNDEENGSVIENTNLNSTPQLV